MKKKNEQDPIKSELILYQIEDGKTRIEVLLQDETVWLSINQMAELFQRRLNDGNTFKGGVQFVPPLMLEVETTGGKQKRWLKKNDLIVAVIS